MLYDNAQVARGYLDAYQVTNDPFFKQIVTETLDFIAREMAHPLGGFYSSLDADSEGEEGKFYVWTPQEMRQALGDDAELALAAYGVSEAGNFEGKNVLQRALSDEQLAEQLKLALEAVPERLGRIHARLLLARQERVRPRTDDKVLTGWNALMLLALAEAARYLG